MKNEIIWKDIPNYSDRYEVSNMGKVRSKPFIRKGKGGCEYNVKGKELKGTINKVTGYIQYMLYNTEGKNKLLCAHTLVADAFLNKPADNQDLMVIHKDGDRLNNALSNLRYAYKSNEKNIQNNIEILPKRKPKQPKYRYVIKQLFLNGLCLAVYSNWLELNKLGYKKQSIMTAANGKYGPAKKDIYKGFKWEIIRQKNYVND